MRLLAPARTALIAAIAVSAAIAWPAMAEPLAHGTAPQISIWRIAAALLLCLLLALAAALALKARMSGRLPGLAAGKLPALKLNASPLARFLKSPAPRRLRAVETIRISPYADICLFRCDGKIFLVAATPQGVTVLETREEEADPTEEPT